ncbi:MAG: metal ABC transporter solute-binding protein, Zn/Mn family [Planctomycetota bacterium]
MIAQTPPSVRLAATAALGIVSLLQPPAASAADAIPVVTGVAPVAYLVEKIAGERAQVSVLLPPGQQCAHNLSLTPKQMIDLGKARVFVSVGMPFEQQLIEKTRAINARLAVIDAAAGIGRRRLGGDVLEDEHHEHASHDHAHDDHADHDHAHGAGETDPHVWLAPKQLRRLADNIAAGLATNDPAHAKTYRANHDQLVKEIDATAAELDRVLCPLKGKTIYVYHPAFGYLTDTYGLTQKAVEAGGTAPSAKQLRELMHQAKVDGARVVFAEPEFDRRGAELIAQAIGGKVVVVDPLAKNVLENLKSMAAEFADAVR